MKKLSLLTLVAAVGLACQQPVGPNQVRAEDVVLSNGGNNLQSSNLQQALDSEMRVNLAELLPGTTWNVTNKSSDETYRNTTGRISFTSTGSVMRLEAGRFAVAGQVHTSEGAFCNPHTDMSYEVLADSVLFVSSESQGSTAITVASATTNRILLVGTGGCGELGSTRVSILTR
ncbi:MAG TPA: hypothetical protein VK447_11290 [Myxococcaceae bacterium]|nr:hypothetical protein [Myxococcaceae bacterium]